MQKNPIDWSKISAEGFCTTCLAAGIMLTCDTGSCPRCGAFLTSGMLRHCPKCAYELNSCVFCTQTLSPNLPHNPSQPISLLCTTHNDGRKFVADPDLCLIDGPNCTSTSSTDFKLCVKCAAARKECIVCRQPL